VSGCVDAINAATPAACGAAIELPLRVLVAEPIQVETMEPPGA